MILILGSRFTCGKGVYSDWIYGVDEKNENKWEQTNLKVPGNPELTVCRALPAPTQSMSPPPSPTVTQTFLMSLIWSESSMGDQTSVFVRTVFLGRSQTHAKTVIASTVFINSSVLRWSSFLDSSSSFISTPLQPDSLAIESSSAFRESASLPERAHAGDSEGERAVKVGISWIAPVAVVAGLLSIGAIAALFIMRRRQNTVPCEEADESSEPPVTFREDLTAETECDNPLTSDGSMKSDGAFELSMDPTEA
jgi:hypothetical protein